VLLPKAPNRWTALIVLIPIALSAYTHLWNAGGFPDIFYDEGAYLRRAMNILYYLEPQESETYYDHPYFGQILLAGLFAVSGFPDSLNPSSTLESVESLYMVPKVWMGLFAVVDTLLIYKIVQTRYEDQRMALLASLLFAVMPISWLTRRVLLESLLLPFLLSSILLALSLRNASGGKKQHILVLMSGVCLGLAIFTKVPAVAAIPLVGYLVYSTTGKKIRNLGLWLIPALLIPLLWPLHSISEDRFDYWVASLLSQSQRSSDGIATIFWNFWKIDPVLLLLGLAGLGYSILIKRDFFPILWALPFLILFSLVSYVQYFHVIPLLPIFCISSALWVVDLIRRLWHSKATLVANGALASFAIYGLLITSLLITTDMTSSQFQAAAFVSNISDEDTTIVSNPTYSWLYNFVLYKPHALGDYRDVLYVPLPISNVVLISEPHFQASMGDEPKLEELYNRTSSIRVFHGQIQNYDVDSYPYSSLSVTGQGELIDIRQYPAP